MNIIFYSDDNRGKDILNDNYPMLAIISHDGKAAYTLILDVVESCLMRDA